MATHIALLRGINVGGRNKLPMKNLAAIFAAAGCDDVETYIQSGNVVFSADARLAKKVGGLVREAITEEFGYTIPVVTRSAKEFAAAVAANPYEVIAGEEKRIHIGFLADHPTAEGLATLDPDRSPTDEFTVIGRDIFLNFGGDMARSKLTNAYFDSKLQTVSTWRNWNTANKLLAIVSNR